MANMPKNVSVVDIHHLAAVVRNLIDNVLIIDSRSFLEYNTCHVINAINVCCSKIVKRRLQQNKISIKELLIHACHCDVDESYDIVVYDQGSIDADSLPQDSFITVLLQKLQSSFISVNLVQGGFLEFQAIYPNLCEDKTRKCVPLTSLSQPCLPIANQGPTRILPFLYLGSQHDALNKETLQNHNITYELNVSTTCPKPDFIQETHFMRIPVNDNYSEKLLPYFHEAFQFLDKVREASGCVLVHCLAGISRSATVAIAYVMQHLQMNSDDAYRYVKSKRATISPNFNFLGQLLEFEKQLQRKLAIKMKPEVYTAPVLGEEYRLKFKLSSPFFNINTKKDNCRGDFFQNSHLKNDSFAVTTKVQYGSVREIQRDRSHSCAADWLSVNEDNTTERKYTALEQKPENDNKMMEKMSQTTLYKHTLRWKGCVEEEHLEGEGWNIKGIPVSSLRELNFTPCQTSNNAGSCSQEFKRQSQRALHYNDFLSEADLSVTSDISYSYSQTNKCIDYDLGVKSLEEKIESTKSPSFFRAPHAIHLPMCTVPTESHADAAAFDYDAKEYNRSDSVSTSGLGSESSEYAESLYDNPSLSERDDDYGLVHIDSDDEIAVQDSVPFCETTSNDAFSACYSTSLGKCATAVAVSPLSPSEQHFLEDYEEVLDTQGKCELKKNVGSKLYSVDEACCNHEQTLQFLKTDKAENIMCDKEKVSELTQKHEKGDGLHRTQSCPGIPDCWVPPSAKLGDSRHETNLMTTNFDVPCLRKTKISTTEKLKNRYSCSSLDYMDHDASHSLSLTHDSCPDVLHFGGCQKESNSSTAKTPHYHHSVLYNAILT